MEAAQKSSGRTYGLVLVGLVAGGALALWALGQTWVTAQVTEGDLPEQIVTLSGSAIYPVSAAAAWVAIASIAAIVAVSGKGRIAVGAVILAASAGMGVAALAFPLSSQVQRVSAAYTTAPEVTATTSSAWIAVAVATVLTGVCGITVLIAGPSWRSLSSKQSGSAPRKTSDWEALDRGEDPTILA